MPNLCPCPFYICCIRSCALTCEESGATARTLSADVACQQERQCTTAEEGVSRRHTGSVRNPSIRGVGQADKYMSSALLRFRHRDYATHRTYRLCSLLPLSSHKKNGY
jgi:hypothetical protein